MRLEISFIPTVKQRPRVFKVKGNYRVFSPSSEKEKEFKKLLREVYKSPPLKGQLRLSIWIYRKAKRGDLSNFVKFVEDAGNKVLWEDDRQIIEGHYFLFDDKKNPRITIEAREIGNEPGN